MAAAAWTFRAIHTGGNRSTANDGNIVTVAAVGECFNAC